MRGTYGATFISVENKKHDRGILVHIDGNKNGTKTWLSEDRLVGPIVNKITRRYCGVGLGVTLVDFTKLGVGSHIVFTASCEAYDGTICSVKDNDDGVQGFLVKSFCYKLKHFSDDSTRWIPKDRVLDVVLETNPGIPVEDVFEEFQRTKEPVEFGRLGVGSMVYIGHDSGIPCVAEVMASCLQGALVEYKHGDESPPSCWIAWKKILHVCHNEYQKKETTAQQVGTKIMSLLVKNDVYDASEVYMKA